MFAGCLLFFLPFYLASPENFLANYQVAFKNGTFAVLLRK
jgi:hypothetical protein